VSTISTRCVQNTSEDMETRVLILTPPSGKSECMGPAILDPVSRSTDCMETSVC
jgi:hypothetical protein